MRLRSKGRHANGRDLNLPRLINRFCVLQWLLERDVSLVNSGDRARDAVFDATFVL